MSLKEKTTDIFAQHFGAAPTHFFRAPGRVNLIGEHTDYNDGFVLPCAIDYQTVIAAAPRLKLIQHQGVGYDNVDVAAATEAGVPVGLTPEGTSIPVAEHVILLILSLYRNLLLANRTLRQGQWLQWELRPRSYDLRGKRLGIVGLGRIGREVAQRARAFECELLYHDAVRAPTDVEAELGVEYTTLDDLLARSDIVTLHVPQTDETRGMIGAQELARMKPSAYFVNSCRGGVVDEAALIRALEGRHIAGAGLDVFIYEPLPEDSPLCDLDNVILTPHIGGGTGTTRPLELGEAVAEAVRILGGEKPGIDLG